MVRNRLLLVALGGCVLTPAAWADDVGYIDCSNHPEETQVLAKAAKTQETVASLPCGERFAILQSGFFFSRIQTRDGKVGFIYTNLIARDYAANAAPQMQAPAQPPPTPAKMAARSSNPIASIASVFKPKSAPAQSLRVPAPPTPAPAAPANPPQTSAAAVQTAPVKPTQPEPAPVEAATKSTPAETSNFPPKSAVIVQSEVAPTGQPPAASATPPPPPPVEPAVPASTASVTINLPEASATVATPEPSAPARPKPESAQPTPAAFHPESPKPGWQKPDRGSRGTSLIELFGGYGFARMVSGGTTNMHGALGSFGWNATSWLQLVADSSYNTVTTNGVKTVLYGNHYGPRLFWHRRNRWGARPFVEGFIGGTRADTKFSGTAGYNTSVQSISYKVGGGLDIRTSRYLEIRLFDVDYYRTSFTGAATPSQNNYWASAGIILRLFGGGSE